jgi:uncharacterized protein YcbX
MASPEPHEQRSVLTIHRYPVKSMIGEALSESVVTERGLLGDRAYALIDVESGKVVSAKNPRKWGDFFAFRAALVKSPELSASIPAARITFPNGESATTELPDVDARLSAELGRSVRLASSVPDAPRIEGYWPDYDWLETPDAVFEVKLPSGTFFDGAVVHLVTTAALDRLHALAPESRFDVARFRPNLVIQTVNGDDGFVEDAWSGRTLLIGDEVRLRIAGPCSRCVMTTLPQRTLPKDPNVLRTIVKHNQGNLGVLASVDRGGHIARGDTVVVE